MAAHTETALEDALRFACSVVGISQLKSQQKEAIQAFAQGHDVFVSLPTGFGKSLCYALLPLVFDHLLHRCAGTSIVLVLSPLTALMLEQRNKFVLKGISAEFVGELQTDLHCMNAVKEGKVQLVYISPESLLLNPQWREMLLSKPYQENLVGVAVDEAHCIVQW